MKRSIVIVALYATFFTNVTGAYAAVQKATGVAPIKSGARMEATKSAFERAADEAAYLAVERVLDLALTRDDFEAIFADLLFDARRYSRQVGTPQQYGDEVTCAVTFEYDEERIQARAAQSGLFDDFLADSDLNCLVFIPEMSLTEERHHWSASSGMAAAEAGVEATLQAAGLSTFRGQARPVGPEIPDADPLVHYLDAWGRVVTKVIPTRYWKLADEYGYESVAADIHNGRYEEAYARLSGQGIDIVVMGRASAESTRPGVSGQSAARAVVELHAFMADSKRSVTSRVESASSSDISSDAAAITALSEAGSKAAWALVAQLVKRVQEKQCTKIRLTLNGLGALYLDDIRSRLASIDGVRYITTKTVNKREIVLEVRFDGSTSLLVESLAGKVDDSLQVYLYVKEAGPESISIQFEAYEEDEPSN